MSEQLEPYRKLDFSGKILPGVFLKFCQRVIAENQSAEDGDEHHLDSDDTFLIKHCGCFAIM